MTILNTSVLAALPCFEAAARLGSFTHAGFELHLTTSAVSQQIRQLEKRLGCVLFSRQGRGLQLTSAGAKLLEAVTTSLGGLRDAIVSLEPSAAPLLVSCSPSFAMLWLMPRLHEFHSMHPDVVIKLVAEFQTIDQASLASGPIDAAIRYDTTSYRGVQVTELMRETLLPLATARYVEEHGIKGTARFSTSVTLLHDVSPWDGAAANVEWATWLDAAMPSSAVAASSLQYNLFIMALHAARASQGMCMGRLALVRDDLETGALIDFSRHAVASPATYKLITSKADDPRVEALASWLLSECSHFSA